MMGSDRWQERELHDGDWLREDFGRMSVLVHSTMEEWRVAIVHDDERQSLPRRGDNLPAGIEWQRWDRAPSDIKIRFRPVFPDRPVIIRPRNILNLSPRAKATFYVGIPSFVELKAHSEGRFSTLGAWPTHRLSNTWHGTTLSGTLCYAAKTRARRRLVIDDHERFDITCSIEISNQSADTLPFERLYFDTDHLAIFEHDDHLYANHARIRTSDKNADLSGVVFSDSPSIEGASPRLVSEPRKGVVRRSKLTQAFSSVLSSLQDD